MSRKLDNWLKSYLEYAKHNEAPYDFHFWTGVSVIAGALRRKVWFDQLYFRWSPNFYIILVAPSGVATKSTSMNIGMDLLRTLNVHFGPDSVTWQALIDAFEEAAEGIPDDPNDILGGEIDQMSCLTIASSELGTFLDPNNREFVDLLVDMWDGKEVLRRRTRGDAERALYKPWINLIACTTPSWIADNMGKLFITGGFTSRCIPVWAEKKRQLVPYPARVAGKDLRTLRDSLLIDLNDIALIKGEFKMTEEAYKAGEVWYEKMHAEAPSNFALSQLDGYYARKQGHAHKVAMVISAAKRSTRMITVEDFEEACELLHGIEADMPKVFGRIGETLELEKAQNLILIMRQKRTMLRSALYRTIYSKYGTQMQEFNAMLEAAIETGFVKQFSDGTGIKISYCAEE